MEEKDKETIEIERKKEKLKTFLRDKHNLFFIFILIFAIVIRLYYFSLTKNQPLWWDEADYMAYAKNLAGYPTHWIITDQHISFFPYIASLFYRLNLSEIIMKFVLELIPSIAIVLLVYAICLILYKDKRIALISMFLSAVLYEILFNSFRFHVDIPALSIGLLAVYVFFKGYEKKEKIFGKIDPKLTIPLTVTLVALTYSIRRGYFLFGIFFLVYMLATKNFKELIKDKYNWVSLLIAIIMLSVFEVFLFGASIGGAATKYYHGEIPINLSSFDVFKVLFKNPYSKYFHVLFYSFYLGLILILIRIILLYRNIRKEEFNDKKSDFFVIIVIFITMSYFIFFQRATEFGEVRWYLPFILGSFICISKSTLFIADYTKELNKFAPILIILLLIGYSGYYQLAEADFIIKNKKDTFSGIKEVSLYLKENSNPNDVIVSVAVPQPAYYAERKTFTPWELFKDEPEKNITSNFNITLEQFISKLEERKDIKYIIITFSEPHHPKFMREDMYSQNANGQIFLSKIYIALMGTTIDFITGQHDIKQEAKYPNLSIRLVKISGDAFLYEIIR
ncbi:MAG: glycosyltransferase family 39 protein [Candidatus Pacearchaeota archaeon]